MKTIVEELELIPVRALQTAEKPADIEYFQTAKTLGFNIKPIKPDAMGSLPYPEITKEAISKLLWKRLEEVVKKFAGTQPYVMGNSDGFECNEFFGVQWKETPLDKFQGLPPRHVLTALQRAKQTNVFERFAIVTIEEIEDPLLIGITSDSRRGLIDHWDNDIALDEVLALVETQVIGDEQLPF